MVLQHRFLHRDIAPSLTHDPQDSTGPIQYNGQTLGLKDLVLTKLYHVSRGSWQPEFKVNFT